MMLLALLASLAPALALVPDGSRTFEEMLPARDGVKLHTRVVLPRNYEGKKFTAIMDRSPYGYGGLEWFTDLFMPAGFVAVGQDMRGTEKSEGLFSIWHSDADDSQDLGDWVVQQPWSNGEIYTFGASADGLGAFTTVHNSPAWLKAQYFIWTSSIGYDVFYPGGALLQELVDSWIHGTVEGGWGDECYEEIKKNEMRTDWWDAVELTGQYDKIKFPTAFWAGWYDIFLVGNLAAYKGCNEESDPAVRYTSKILLDPLGHCQSGAPFFPKDLIEGRTLLGLMQAYEVYGIRPVVRTVKNVTFYVMSSNDSAGLDTANYWTTLDAFPTPRMDTLYLHSDGSASPTPPTSRAPRTLPSGLPGLLSDSSSYTYNPADPVPTVGGSNLDMPCGPLDQSDIDTRADVLTFQTPPFEAPLFLTGPLFADLYVSSDSIDTDFMVRISDVYPTGEVRLLQDSAVRMRWREGGLQPVYMKPDQVYAVTVSLWNTSYALAPSHSLRIAVTSSNYPRFSANPNTGDLLIQNSTLKTPVIAQNTLHHSERYPSAVRLPVVSRADMPQLHDIKGVFGQAYPHVDVEQILQSHPDLFNEIANRRARSPKSQ